MMKVTIELRKHFFAAGSHKTLWVTTEYKGQLFRREEIFDENWMDSFFDVIFDKAKSEIKEMIKLEAQNANEEAKPRIQNT